MMHNFEEYVKIVEIFMVNLKIIGCLETDGKFRSSRPEMFCKKGVFKTFTKFTGKHLCQSLSPQPATLLKK